MKRWRLLKVCLRALHGPQPSPARRLDRSGLKESFVRLKLITSVRFDWLWDFACTMEQATLQLGCELYDDKLSTPNAQQL